MRIMVTGHRGYIGTVLVPLLSAQGHEVVGVDSDLYRGCTFGAPIPRIDQGARDIRSLGPADFRGVHSVIHLAGLSNDPLGLLNPKLTMAVNHRATLTLAETARQVGVRRFVFASSCSNYGTSGEAWVTENSPFRPVTPYGRAKAKAEQGLAALAMEGFSPTFLRCATAYGVSPMLRFDLVLNNLVAWACATGQVRLKSDGMAWRPLVHVEDIALAIIAVLDAPADRVHNQAFNVGQTEENFRVRDLADIVARTIPGTRVEYAPDASRDQRCYRVDCSSIHRALPGFRPRWNVQKGAIELYEALRSKAISPEDFEGPRFSRVACLRRRMAAGDIGPDLEWRSGAGDRRDVP
ncbi:MAG: NAD(P)-dependent oxidoreductase [Desulfobacterales bacterium]|nr:NAD(P)-dependent oxidoreductase [Desulfobacterales bacterium]